MEIVIEELFKEQFKKCPVSFQIQFRKVYQQLKAVDKPLEVKSIIAINHIKNYYKLNIDKSRIGMHVKSGRLHITCFLYNQYF
jgi:hypothetical protein